MFMDAGQHATPKNSSLLRKTVGVILFFLIVLGMQFFSREFVFEAYAVPSGSMETTISTGDKIYSEQVSYYFRDVEAGDIITFEDPTIQGRFLLKRCIAVGGQTVDLQNGVVYVDGVAQSEPYTHGKPSDPLSRTTEDITYPYTVPKGYVWVMGDNRTDSADSRYFGPIPVSSVSGRAFFVFWPLDHLGTLE